MKRFSILSVFLLTVSVFFGQPKTVTVRIESNPSGALVKLQGSSSAIGSTPLSTTFTRNHTYTLEFTRTGYKPTVFSFKADGSPVTVNLESEAVKYNLNIQTPGITGAQVYIDGKSVGSSPVTAYLDGGSKSIKITQPGYTDYNTVINLNGHMTLNAEMQRTKSSFSVTANVNGASVFINNSFYGQTPLKIALDNGTYNLRVELSGYRQFQTTLSVQGDMSVPVNLERDTVNLTIQATGLVGAQVFVDGKSVGSTPVTTAVEPGNRRVRVTFPGYINYETSLSITGPMTVNADLMRVKSTLGVTANVNGAAVFINNSPAGQIPFKTSLENGTYNVRVELFGYKSFQTTVNLQGDINIPVNLEKESDASFRIPASAKIFLNGVEVKTAETKGRIQTIRLVGDKPVNTVKVTFHGLEVTKTFEFNGGTYELTLDLLQK